MSTLPEHVSQSLTLFQNIPLELQHRKQWVGWRYEETVNGKPTKVPYNVMNGQLASVTNPATWSTFQQAVAAYADCIGYSGIGYVLWEHDPYTGIDLDHHEHTTQEDRDTQNRILAAMDSYSEWSPSGKGLHVIIKGVLPGPGRKRSSVELYSKSRYLTFTGNVFHNVPIQERQSVLETVYGEMGQHAPAWAYSGDAEQQHSDEEIISQALNAINGNKFGVLHHGDWQQLYTSQSEADFAYIDIIAFYTKNRAQIKRIFRASPLGQRDKAKRNDYVDWMINKAFDRMLPAINLIGLETAFQRACAPMSA